MTSQSHPTKTALLLIDVQEGFLHPTHWGPSRSNPDFEQNASSLLNSYRSLITSSPSQHKIVHIQHSSRDPNSELHPSSPGFAFQEFAMPKDGELVIVKEVNSALIGTNLEEVLRGHFVGRSGKLYIAGLSMYTSFLESQCLTKK
jgi:nicotinamidase-related amidase